MTTDRLINGLVRMLQLGVGHYQEAFTRRRRNSRGDKKIFRAGEAVAAGERFLVIERSLGVQCLVRYSLVSAFDFDLSHVVQEEWSPGSIKIWE